MRELSRFAVRDDVRDGESGHGYALRMATANGLNGLPDVKKMLGKSRFAVLDGADAAEISQWFGADPLRLALALGYTGTGSEPDAYELGGVKLTRSYFINRSQPRVCCECLAEGGYCRLCWELSATTSCSIHSTTLCASCPNCGYALRWDRPHILQCRCGWILRCAGVTDRATSEESDVCRWIAAGLDGDDFGVPVTALGRLLAPLSVDAGLHVLSALASVQRGCEQAGIKFRPALRKRSSLASAREAIAQAVRALDEFGKGLHGRWRIPITAIELLAEACASSYQAADRQLAMSLLASVRSKPLTANWSGRFPQISQLNLF